MLRKTKALAATAAVALAATGVASAAVEFDPATGTGTVGKGDVQTALGLNNDGVQNATIGFQFTEQRSYTVTCETTSEGAWVPNAGGQLRYVPGVKVNSTSTALSNKELSVNSGTKNAKKGLDSSGQITGFILNGLAVDTSAPDLSGECADGETYVGAERDSSPAVPVSLSVSDGGAPVDLKTWPAPAADEELIDVNVEEIL